MQDDVLLTTEDVATLLNVKPRTLKQWRYERRGPRYVSLGRRIVRYRRSDVDEWIRSREKES
nr:MAG: hypothetical protein DIU80_23905 [Chloroflexota bacterium]